MDTCDDPLRVHWSKRMGCLSSCQCEEEVCESPLSYSVIAPLWGGGTQALLRQTEHKPKLMFPIVQNERARERLEATCLGASRTNAALLKEYGKSCFLVGEILSGKYLQNFTISARRLERPTKELKVFLSTH